MTLKEIDPLYTRSWLDSKLNTLIKQAVVCLVEEEDVEKQSIIATTYADILFFFDFDGNSPLDVENEIWRRYYNEE